MSPLYRTFRLAIPRKQANGRQKSCEVQKCIAYNFSLCFLSNDQKSYTIWWKFDTVLSETNLVQMFETQWMYYLHRNSSARAARTAWNLQHDLQQTWTISFSTGRTRHADWNRLHVLHNSAHEFTIHSHALAVYLYHFNFWIPILVLSIAFMTAEPQCAANRQLLVFCWTYPQQFHIA